VLGGCGTDSNKIVFREGPFDLTPEQGDIDHPPGVDARNNDYWRFILWGKGCTYWNNGGDDHSGGTLTCGDMKVQCVNQPAGDTVDCGNGYRQHETAWCSWHSDDDPTPGCPVSVLRAFPPN
jgi:hypothetical protein